MEDTFLLLVLDIDGTIVKEPTKPSAAVIQAIKKANILCAQKSMKAVMDRQHYQNLITPKVLAADL